MIQTLVLANSVHRLHSQISMRILSLSLFHKIVEIRNCGLNAHLMSCSGWSWYPCLVLKIVLSLKNSFTTVCSWKTRAFVACRHRSEIFGSVVWTSTQNWVRLYSCRLCSSISCSEMQSTSQWTCNSGLKRASHPVKCFDVIVRRDISIHRGEMLEGVQENLTNAEPINFYLFCKCV